MVQIGSFPQVGVKTKHIWNHHLVYVYKYIYIPWKSKTKQRMVFGMIHVKDSLLPKGNVWSLDFLGMEVPQKVHSKTKRWFSSMDNAVCTYSRLHRGRNQSWKCNATYETTSSSLLHGCSIFGKGCKGQTQNYGKVFACRCIHTHIQSY